MLRGAWLFGLFVVAACSSSYDGVSATGDAAPPDAASANDASTDGGGVTCVAPSCDGAGASCKSFDFAGPACPPEWTLAGDLTLGATIDCQGGAMHVKASETLDAFGTLELATPSAAFVMRLSARIALSGLPGKRVLALAPATGPSFVELRALERPDGEPSVTVCNASGACTAAFDAKSGESHLFTFELANANVDAFVDCVRLGSVPTEPLPMGEKLLLIAGATDGIKADLTFDDVVVSFR